MSIRERDRVLIVHIQFQCRFRKWCTTRFHCTTWKNENEQINPILIWVRILCIRYYKILGCMMQIRPAVKRSSDYWENKHNKKDTRSHPESEHRTVNTHKIPKDITLFLFRCVIVVGGGAFDGTRIERRFSPRQRSAHYKEIKYPTEWTRRQNE